MAKFIAVHTLKKSLDEVNRFMEDGSPELARAMAAGETPCKCIKSWNPFAHGRTDLMFCLWEANKTAEIEETIEKFGLNEFITTDLLQVDEIDWAQLAKELDDHMVAH